jgi:hypothetical protein
MIKWIRPSGTEIETNESEASIEVAKALGWKRADKAEKPKKARRTKEQMKADNQDGNSSVSH